MPKGFKGFQKGNKFGYATKPGRDYNGKNNPNYGRKYSKETKEKIRQAKLKRGFYGTSYGAIHNWAERYIKKPLFCPRCNENKDTELSNTGHTYKKVIDDWEWLCHKCHMWKDGRQFNLKQYAKTIHNSNSIYRIHSSNR